MAVTVNVGTPTRWWTWTEIATHEQLAWLPVDYRLRDADGIECLAVGAGVTPGGWVAVDSNETHVPRLPARVV